MISYDKAKQLKELGLKWNPKCGDWYKVEHWPIKNNIWLPSLKQLLDKIKEYNWTYALYSENEIEIETRLEYISLIDRNRNFEGEIIEDIVADALIWILKCKKHYI